MKDMNNNSVHGKLSRDAWQRWLPGIADEIAGTFCNSYIIRQTIQKYAIRTGASHILAADRDEERHILRYRIDRAGLSREIMSLLADFVSGEIAHLGLAEAIRNQDPGRIKILLREKCRSALEDGARNPRFRAIRNVVSNAAAEGLLNYRPARGLYGETGGNWACYAFSEDKELDILHNQEDTGNYENWPLPPLIENTKPEESGSQITQKKLVLEAAWFFWNETVQRHGPVMVPLLDLQSYMEKKFPPWIMTAFLPDPLSILTTHDSAWDPETEEGDYPLFGHNIPSTSALWSVGEDEQAPEDAILRETALNLAENWLISLKDKDAMIFCMRYHCEYTLKKIAKKLNLPTEQHVDYHYNACIRKLKDFCTRQEGLSPPDEDPTLAKLLAEMLGEVCTQQILKGGCE